MFCPKCGKSHQKENTYCRQCGEFLPDFSKKKLQFGGNTPEEQINTNLFLNFLSGMVSLILATLLYANFGFRTGTPLIIYIVGAFLLAMCGWQFSTIVIGLRLKENFSNRKNTLEIENNPAEKINSAKAKNLKEVDYCDVVPASITEKTTRQLSEKMKNNSTHTEHQSDRTI